MTDFATVSLEDLENTPNPTRRKLEVDEALGVTEFGFNVYVADPGEQVPWGRHRHPDHEELFFVLSGELTVETPDGDYTVGPDEAFFVPKNGLNRAVATGEEPCRFVAVGAPKDQDGAVIEEACPHCGEVTDRDYEIVDDGGTYVLTCSACGEEVTRFSA